MTEETMVVLTTCGNDDDARELARALVERRIAACVNAVSRVASTYRWKGEVRQDQETLLIIKTTAPRLAALEQAVREHSKYELPELIVLPVKTGAADYLAWVGESVAELED
jgi:periplasmic divalent cation tolerance protein